MSRLPAWKRAEIAHVEASLKGVICERCGATLETIADVCQGNLQMYPGLHRIEDAKAEFPGRGRPRS